MCRLRNDDLVTALVDVHNLNSFRCHQRGSDQFSNEKDERRRGPTGRVINLYVQIL